MASLSDVTAAKEKGRLFPHNENINYGNMIDDGWLHIKAEDYPAGTLPAGSSVWLPNPKWTDDEYNEMLKSAEENSLTQQKVNAEKKNKGPQKKAEKKKIKSQQKADAREVKIESDFNAGKITETEKNEALKTSRAQLEAENKKTDEDLAKKTVQPTSKGLMSVQELEQQRETGKAVEPVFKSDDLSKKNAASGTAKNLESISEAEKKEIASDVSEDMDTSTPARAEKSIANAVEEIAQNTKNINPFYDEGLPANVFQMYRDGKFGKISFTEKEKEKMRSNGMTEDEIKAEEKLLRKRAIRTTTYFIVDHLSKGIQNAGASLGAIGGANLQKADPSALDNLRNEMMKGSVERLNDTLKAGTTQQSSATGDVASNLTADIRGQSKALENADYDIFKQELAKELANFNLANDKDMAEFQKNLTIEQAIAIQEAYNELQLEMEKASPQAKAEGEYAMIKEVAKRNPAIVNKYAKMVFKQDASRFMTPKEKWEVGLAVGKSVVGAAGTAVGAAAKAYTGGGI